MREGGLGGAHLIQEKKFFMRVTNALLRGGARIRASTVSEAGELEFFC